MAFHAVAAIAGKFDVIKIGGVPVNREVGQQVLARMNLVDQELKWMPWSRNLSAGRSSASVALALWQNWQYSTFKRWLPCSAKVPWQLLQFSVVITERSSYRGTVSHCKREDLIEASVAHLDFFGRPRLQGNEPVALNGHGITTLGIGWDRLLEGVRQHAVLAGRVQSALPPIGGEVGIRPGD